MKEKPEEHTQGHMISDLLTFRVTEAELKNLE